MVPGWSVDAARDGAIVDGAAMHAPAPGWIASMIEVSISQAWPMPPGGEVRIRPKAWAARVQ